MGENWKWHSISQNLCTRCVSLWLGIDQFYPAELLQWWWGNHAFHLCQMNTLRPWQNGRHFADDIFECIFFNENYCISIQISLKYVPRGPIINMPALVQIMTPRQTGFNVLSNPEWYEWIKKSTENWWYTLEWNYVLLSDKCQLLENSIQNLMKNCRDILQNMPDMLLFSYHKTSDIRHQIPKLKCFLSCLVVVVAQSIEARC